MHPSRRFLDICNAPNYEEAVPLPQDENARDRFFSTHIEAAKTLKTWVTDGCLPANAPPNADVVGTKRRPVKRPPPAALSAPSSRSSGPAASSSPLPAPSISTATNQAASLSTFSPSAVLPPTTADWSAVPAAPAPATTTSQVAAGGAVRTTKRARRRNVPANTQSYAMPTGFEQASTVTRSGRKSQPPPTLSIARVVFLNEEQHRELMRSG